MKKNLNYLIFLSVLCITACKKETTPKNEEIIIDKKTIRDNSKLAITPKYSALGHGYDVTGEFFNISAVRNGVINIEKLKSDYPQRVDEYSTPLNHTMISAGENSSEFASDMTKKFTTSANFLLFKASVHAAHSDQNRKSNKYSYANLSMMIKQRTAKLNAPKALLISDYLSEEFKYDMNVLNSQELVQAYGTHVLTNIHLGAKLDLNYRSETKGSNRKNTVISGAAVNGLFKFFNASADFSYNSSLSTYNYNESLSYRLVGGDPSRSLITEIDLKNPISKMNLAPWLNTCTYENSTLIEIVQDTSIPLYELIADPVKKQTLKTYIEWYLQNNQVRNLGDAPVYSYFSARHMDHVYKMQDEPVAGGDHVAQGVQYYAFPTQLEGTVPVYGFFSARHMDHVYKTQNEPVPGGDHQPQGIQFYVYPTPAQGRVPVYSYFSARFMDHIYKTDLGPVPGGDHVLEGIAFYVPL